MSLTPRYIPSMPHCHPARYNPGFMYPHVRSNPHRYITSARRGTTRPHGIRPAILGVIQGKICAMQAVLQVLRSLSLDKGDR